MARSDLTLAALATTAVPDLIITSVTEPAVPAEDGYREALLHDDRGRSLIVREPLGGPAEAELGADLVALAAMTNGVRSRLPFDVPTVLGQAPTSDSRVVVLEQLSGFPAALDALDASEGVTTSIGYAIGALHALPTSFVSDAGLPSLSAADCRARVRHTIDQAHETGLLPVTLRERWRRAAEDGSLWQFEPTVVNGSLTATSFFVDGTTVTAVVGWSALRVGDPAVDLHWLTTARDGVLETALEAYRAARGAAPGPETARRATLHAELELARWLLHGRERHDDAITADAVGLLDALVDRVRAAAHDDLAAQDDPALAVAEVETMLEHTPGNASATRPAGLEPVDDLADRTDGGEQGEHGDELTEELRDQLTDGLGDELDDLPPER